MDALKLLGAVFAVVIARKLDHDQGDGGFARFLLYPMADDEILAVVDALLERPGLADRLEISLPRYRFVDRGLNDAFLTDQNTTVLRHLECTREGRVMALLDDSQAQSLAQVDKLDADALLDERAADLWIEQAGGPGLELSQRREWRANLVALMSLGRVPLRRLAAYVAETAEHLEALDSVAQACGRALPSLGLPRSDSLFDDGIPAAKRGQPSQWRQRFVSHWRLEAYGYKRDLNQSPFNRRRLAAMLDGQRQLASPELFADFEAYAAAPDGRSAQADALLRRDWSEVAPFFTDTPRQTAPSLGELTKAHFDRSEPGLLSDADLAYVDELAQRGRAPTREDADEAFYSRNAQHMLDDASLRAGWDAFVYGKEIVARDFLDGLVQCLRRTLSNEPGPRVLVVEGLEKAPNHFLGLNDEVCRTFAARYRGLPASLAGMVEFRAAKAFDYDAFADEIWSLPRRRRGRDSTARRSRQLRFNVHLERRSGSEVIGKTPPIRLSWECDLNSVGVGFVGDLDRLRDNRTRSALVRCTAGRRRAATRARAAGLSLMDLGGLEPASGRDRGSFVPAKSQCVSLAAAWRSALATCVSRNLISGEVGEALGGTFGVFEQAYADALEGLHAAGAGDLRVAAQATAYAELLERTVQTVRAPLALESLLEPLLAVGSATVDPAGGARSVAVVCPWHPLRLAVQHARLVRLREVLSGLFGPEAPTFTDDGRLFFNELTRSLAHPGRPDVMPVWSEDGSRSLLTLTDALNDYSLHEPPVTRESAGAASNENAAPTARQVADLVRRYIALQPHERDNLSVVLFNCDAAALPQAVVDQIRQEAERSDGEAMCQVLLRHTDEAQLRSLYQHLVNRELDDDSLHASETSRDFMARMRIQVLVNQSAAAATGAGGPPLDIVFCHDVISRQARLVWPEVDRITPATTLVDPTQWSRRVPVGRGEADAVVLLPAPAHPREGWAYLDVVAALHDRELAAGARALGRCRVPARSTDVRSAQTRQVLEETHRLGAWVVNVDDLLDRRQLLNTGIDVIRYKRVAEGGRSLVISSRAPDSLLRATLRKRLRSLDLGLDDGRIEALAAKLVTSANGLSGDLVLRAAKRGANASELIGVVLSRHLVEAELGAERRLGWSFLDDYASWLGQDERRIADLLCLAPTLDEDGRPVLDVVVTEAKYVSESGAVKGARDSAHQLKDTLRRLEAALQPEDAAPLDRPIWLARLSDMLVDGLGDTLADDAAFWRTEFREGRCPVRIRGYSHVFVHGPADVEPATGDQFLGVAHTRSGVQEVYGRASVRALMRSFADGGDPMPIRRALAGAAYFELQPAPAVAAPVADAELHVETPDATDTPAAALEASEIAPPPDKHLPRFRAALAAGPAPRSAEAADLWLSETAARCRSALLSYGLSGRLEAQVLTPNAALLKFRGSDALTVAKVESKLEELETTHGLEVLTVRAEPGRVVISIKRPQREVLGLEQVWRDWRPDPQRPNTRLLIAVKEDDGGPLYLEPEPAPHTLVAGSTGSGKSVLVQNILLGIAATNTPAQARIVLIDPKAGVDYFAFEDLPHLDGGIVDAPETALERLNGLVEEMERRYGLFRAARASNLAAYNRAAVDPLPMIWVVHDEFADWMQIDSYRDGVEAVVSRLGVKARAAGIYLIFAAQRPDNTVFPMQLRSNLGNRLVLRVDSAGTSDLSLGVKGGRAERLLGKGHLAAVLGGASPIYAQVPYLDEARLSELVEALRLDYAAR